MTALLILIGLCAALSVVALAVGGTARLSSGLQEAVDLLIAFAPQIVAGFVVAGIASVLIPVSLVSQYIGEGSGLQGLVIATVAGAITPGGPILHFPLIAVLFRSGASEGAVAAYLTAWALLSLNRMLVWEIPVLGPAFAITRWSVCLIVPIFVGLGVQTVTRLARPA